MKKTFFILVLIFLAIMIGIYMNYKQMLVAKTEAQKFNSEYEFYNKESIFGTDITTVINKAVNHNEKIGLPKDENGMYISDEKSSVKIYVHMMINDKTYPMEALQKTGLGDFTKYFGEVHFKCTNIKYHEETGKIAEMTFAAIEN